MCLWCLFRTVLRQLWNWLRTNLSVVSFSCFLLFWGHLKRGTAHLGTLNELFRPYTCFSHVVAKEKFEPQWIWDRTHQSFPSRTFSKPPESKQSVCFLGSLTTHSSSMTCWKFTSFSYWLVAFADTAYSRVRRHRFCNHTFCTLSKHIEIPLWR